MHPFLAAPWPTSREVHGIGDTWQLRMLTHAEYMPSFLDHIQVLECLEFSVSVAPKILLRLAQSSYPSLSFWDRPQDSAFNSKLRIGQEAPVGGVCGSSLDAWFGWSYIRYMWSHLCCKTKSIVEKEWKALMTMDKVSLFLCYDGSKFKKYTNSLALLHSKGKT